MNTKKVTTLSLFTALLLSSIFLTTFVSAGLGTDIADGIKKGASEIQPIVEIILGGDGLSGEMLFIKLLMFFLLFAILMRVVSEVPVLDSPVVSKVVAVAITLLTVRFLGTEGLIQFMWLPQGILGVLLITMIPFLIFFYLMKSFSGEPIIVKIGWSAFAVIYAALAYTRWDELSYGTQWWSNYGFIYLIIAILSVAMIVAGKAMARHAARRSRLVGRADNLRTKLADREQKLRDAQNALAANDNAINRDWVKREKKRLANMEKLVKKAEKGE